MRFATLLLLMVACRDTVPSHGTTGLPELLVPREGGIVPFKHPESACVDCHPQHVAEWRESNHAYAMADPVFHAMVRAGQRDSEGKLGQFCVQCHTPTGFLQGQTPIVQDPETGDAMQDFSGLDAVGHAGVTCDVCHTMTEVMEPVNAQVAYTPDGTYRATLQDPVATPAHGSEYSELHTTGRMCGSCHDVTNPAGALIEETFSEWDASPQAAAGITCQDCHMPEYSGKAAVDGPERTVHRHTFVGVDVSLLEPHEFPGYWSLREKTAELLKSAARVAMVPSRDRRELVVHIQNLAGHSLPSGATAEREMWLEVIIRRPNGTIAWASGTLDSQGDLRDDNPEHTLRPGTDPQLSRWAQVMWSAPPKAAGAVPVHFPWQAKDVVNRLIPAGAAEQVRYDLSALEDGCFSATARLRFRSFPPYFLRKLEEVGGLDPAVKSRVPIVDMWQDTQQLAFGEGCPTP